jgi:hypothetical protein
MQFCFDEPAVFDEPALNVKLSRTHAQSNSHRFGIELTVAGQKKSGCGAAGLLLSKVTVGTTPDRVSRSPCRNGRRRFFP